MKLTLRATAVLLSFNVVSLSPGFQCHDALAAGAAKSSSGNFSENHAIDKVGVETSDRINLTSLIDLNTSPNIDLSLGEITPTDTINPLPDPAVAADYDAAEAEEINKSAPTSAIATTNFLSSRFTKAIAKTKGQFARLRQIAKDITISKTKTIAEQIAEFGKFFENRGLNQSLAPFSLGRLQPAYSGGHSAPQSPNHAELGRIALKMRAVKDGTSNSLAAPPSPVRLSNKVPLAEDKRQAGNTNTTTMMEILGMGLPALLAIATISPLSGYAVAFVTAALGFLAWREAQVKPIVPTWALMVSPAIAGAVFALFYPLVAPAYVMSLGFLSLVASFAALIACTLLSRRPMLPDPIKRISGWGESISFFTFFVSLAALSVGFFGVVVKSLAAML